MEIRSNQYKKYNLSEAVGKVVLVVPGEGVDTVSEHAHLGAFASSREVVLQRPRSRVLDGDDVRVVGPHLQCKIQIVGTRKSNRA